MAFVLSPIENIEFEIPDGKGGVLLLTVPPLDGLTPADIDKINAALEVIPEDTPEHRNPSKSPHAQTRFMLEHYNPGKAKKEAIWALTARHLQELTDHWNKESGMDLGESAPSTEQSSAGTE